MKTKRKHIELSILFGLIFAILVSFSGFDAACADIRKNVVRLHIIANSDSACDQELKLKVRDAILAESEAIFENSDNYTEAVSVCTENLEFFEDIANRTIAENGFDYTAVAEFTTCYFETRHYESFTLPAGNYQSLNIKLGKKEGKNWWCVVFPAVCIPAAVDTDLSKSVNEEGVKITSNPTKYIMKFKIVEIYENIKNALKFS